MQQRWEFPRTAMCRLAVPRLSPGAIPENGVFGLSEEGSQDVYLPYMK